MSAPANNGVPPTSMQALNYATDYGRALSQKFPYVLNFGKLYSTPNNGRFRWINAKTIEIPSISTTGRVNANRDSISLAQRNFDNSWEPKTLTNERKWSTLVHPKDIDQTNMVTTIANITQVFNEEHKFPEMDAYCVSKIYTDWLATTNTDTGVAHTPDTTVLTAENILSVFDKLMLEMDNRRVPPNGRILYVTNEISYMLKNAEKISRSMDITSGPNKIDRRINRLEEVEVIPVPATLMKTAYDFTSDWAIDPSADQINMMLIHPLAVITPVSYEFSKLDAPSAGSEGKYIYYEESFEDVFILNKKSDAIQFNITAGSGTTTTA
jgi:hypothetical protein